MSRPRVLVTGPVDAIAEYVEAARGAGWDGIAMPLLRIEPRRPDLARLRTIDPEWICITSASALAFLEAAFAALPALRARPCAVVGERTAARLRELGATPAFDPASDASDLAGALLARAAKGARVLWPRGSLSDELARRLREGGLEVDDPIAYATISIEDDTIAPDTEAIFLASPSAVRAWHQRPATPSAHRQVAIAPQRRQVAIAIGPTTFDALLQETESRFFDTISLPRPTPEAFAIVLAHIDVATPP
jgi:uroporphyrinogen-III synthase